MRGINEEFLTTAKRGNLALIKELLDRGANIKAVDAFGWTALHWAAMFGYTGVLKELLDRGADITSRTDAGKTALHLATYMNRTDATRELLNRGATADEKLVKEINELFKREENPVTMVQGEDGLFRSNEYLARCAQKAAATTILGILTKRNGRGNVPDRDSMPKEMAKAVARIVSERGNTKSFIGPSEEKSR